MWTRPDGADLRPSWLGDRFAALIAGAGLPPIRFHDLRHVAATMMLAAKVDLKVIQETLGHETLQTTSDLYTSVLPELARDAAEATVALIPRAPRQTLGHPSGTNSERGWQCRNINKTAARRGLSAVSSGAPEGIRTPNLLIRSQMLYPLSYGRVFSCARRTE
ncbi:Phage integrase family protein [Actinokineospora alba]|uniref:Phage integrase family protein n=1 Tax=Actinokineospora alba TaxID=504798 RepID=A0A1H0T784_9PSEU|nr:Phage integrase family protein [Actinokineospora alba]SDP49671.1 Phage integrase family protein [Actinokineospora alba]